jgi:arylsulfatase
MRSWQSFVLTLVLTVLASSIASAQAAKKPNILVIFGDDIGVSNVSAYSHGLVGYRTPNIDRIAREGMMFTDYYAEQSCTAGRSAFHHRHRNASHRALEGRCSRRHARSASKRPDHR